MITLDIPPQIETVIQQESEKAGMSIEQYIINKISLPTPMPTAEPQTLGDLFTGEPLESFEGDPVAIQRELRNEWG